MDDRSLPDHERSRMARSFPCCWLPDFSADRFVTVDESMGRGRHPERFDLSSLAALLHRACGPSLVCAVVGRARLQDELTHHLGCPPLLSKKLVDAMIARGLIRQEVHRDGWVHWVLATAPPTAAGRVP